VVLADDDPVFRQALAALLAEEDDFVLVAEATDGEQAVTATAEHEADLVLVDVRMPHGGPGLVRALISLDHRPAVVGLSGNAHAGTWTGFLEAGAAGYLLKTALAGDLAVLLRRCMRRELIVTVPGAAEVLRRLLGSAD
jgi:DNA-binding NarL/FixJ family response regulator